MEKTLTIDGKQVRFKSTAATPLRYKAQFGKDFFKEIYKLDALNNVENTADVFETVDFDFFYNLIWVLAKTANPSIPEPLTWLDEFEEFPLMEIIPELQDLLISTIQSKKK